MFHRLDINLQPGDIFCTRNPMALGRAINAIQTFWASDNESKYSHAGIILDTEGTTYEALWTIKEQNLEEAYIGCGVLIGRTHFMTRAKFEAGLAEVLPFEGRIYPFHRLALHLIPPMAKYISTGQYLVCSELTARFLVGAKCMTSWRGKNPDHLADMIRKWRTWKVVFEGVM